MYTGGKGKLYASLAACGVILSLMPGKNCANEIASYQLTDTGGYFGLRYRYDSNSIQQIAGPENKETRAVFEEEIHVQTQGYVYHPKFLKVDVGGGVVFSQESLKTAAGSAEHNEDSYDFNTRLLFLEEKAYPLTLYYNKAHPLVSLSVTDEYVQENEKYGMNFSLREPVSPFTLNFEAYRQSNKGDSFTQVTNERTDYQNVSAYANLNNGGYAQLSYTNNQQNSLSGAKSLPIQPFSVLTKTTNLNSRVIFGEKQDVNLSLIAIHTTQEQDRNLEESRISPYLTLIHNEKFSSYYQYNLIDRQQANVDSLSRSGAVGLRYHWDKNLYSNAEVHYTDSETTGLRLSSHGANGSISYKHLLGFGSLQLSAGLNYDAYDRVTNGIVQVTDVLYTLVGTSRITLFHEYIDTSTIVVKRADTNEILTEGLANDYVVIVVANQTQIQKVNPALPASLDVLISYQYNPGGTAGYDSLGQNYQVSLEMFKHYTVYMNYRETEQSLTSGTPTLPLESSDTVSYGARIDYPVPFDIDLTVGGNVLSEKHNENLSSYQKNSTDIFAQVALPMSSDLHLSVGRLQVDYLYSTEDVDSTRYGLRLRSNPANRLTVSLLLSDENDTGGSLPRRNRNMTLTAQWRIRRLLIELGARKISEMQRTIRHERTIFNATLRREF